MRAYLEHMLEEPQPVYLYYIEPHFRYDRPQKGRYRQFHQVGAEIIGEEDPILDAKAIYTMKNILEGNRKPAFSAGVTSGLKAAGLKSTLTVVMDVAGFPEKMRKEMAEELGREAPAIAYDAFISYSRRDSIFAQKLYKALSSYTPPAGLGLPSQRRRVFLIARSSRASTTRKPAPNICSAPRSCW